MCVSPGHTWPIYVSAIGLFWCSLVSFDVYRSFSKYFLHVCLSWTCSAYLKYDKCVIRDLYTRKETYKWDLYTSKETYKRDWHIEWNICVGAKVCMPNIPKKLNIYTYKETCKRDLLTLPGKRIKHVERNVERDVCMSQETPKRDL